MIYDHCLPNVFMQPSFLHVHGERASGYCLEWTEKAASGKCVENIFESSDMVDYNGHGQRLCCLLRLELSCGVEDGYLGGGRRLNVRDGNALHLQLTVSPKWLPPHHL